MNTISAALIMILAVGAAAAPTDREIVKVNGTPIRQGEVVERLLKRYGPQMVDEMIDETLLRQAAQQKGLKAEEAEVSRRLSKLQEQFGARELFISQLEQAGSSLSKVRADLAEELLREKLVITARGVKVSDEELKKAFSENKDKLGRPEAVHLRHILVLTQAEGNAIIAKVKAGADFSALAREKSLAASGKAAGGDYGFVARGMLPPEIDAVAFALKPGELKMVPGPRGQHVLQAVAARPAKAAILAEIKEDLREMLLAEKIKKEAPDYLLELRRKADIKSSGAPPPKAVR
ncbi:MAG: peptidyl-prolyl cis-trans isomerase [Elusimicrobiota bacterium]